MSKLEFNLTSIRPLLEARIIIYDLLRHTFLQEPTKDYLDNVKKNIITTEFPFVQENESIFQGITQVKHYLAEKDVFSEQVYSDLHWDFTRLFIGPYELPAPPWESAYCNEERLLFQEETLEVRKAYVKYSFLPVQLGHEADDHLGIELDFMFRLNDLALAEIENKNTNILMQNLTDQKHFLETHLLKWIPDLCEAVIENAHTGFYQGLAKVLKGFLTLELIALNELLEIIS